MHRDAKPTMLFLLAAAGFVPGNAML